MRCATHFLSANLVDNINEVHPLALLDAVDNINGINPNGRPTKQESDNIVIAYRPKGNTRKPLEGIGSDIKTIQRMCADDAETLKLIDIAVQNPVGTNQHTEGDNIVIALSPKGNARQYALRSLRIHTWATCSGKSYIVILATRVLIATIAAMPSTRARATY
jgi:hypothetical protein